MEVPCGINLFTSTKILGILSTDCFILILQTSSLFAKAESCTCVFFQTYPLSFVAPLRVPR